jgi:chromate transporter
MSSPASPGVAGTAPAPRWRTLCGLTGIFLRLGATAFGGPAAHVALMEDEFVRRRGWLQREEFLDLLGATNLIPGPNSTEMAMHIGYRQGGWAGLLLAGLGFILPASLLATGLAMAYVRYGSLPAVGALLVGVKAVVTAVVVQALVSLGRTAVKNGGLAVLGLASVAAVAGGVSELGVLLAAGAITAAVRAFRMRSSRPSPPISMTAALPLALLSPASSLGLAVAPTAVGAGPLFWIFLKIGSVIFGSGYVLLAFLRAELVVRRGWLSEAALLDAIAVGQVTPGPVFTAASFIGYLLGRGPGAVAATVGIFLPAFVLVGASGPLVPRLRRSALAGAFLDGVNVASLALMTLVTWQLGRAALVDPTTVALAVIALGLLLSRRVHPGWLMAAGALVGLFRVWV